ncbi:MBL fold metallo-hydrolase [Pseudoclavibacter helvolus]|uniref:Glyoxylase-like metal-dependent hydrolase (Beta-lactamase superfamily II) n=1 Tax=Pseudoclavibacter helvolus TaxID=255205 RepID=A0A7W4UNF3_9MICO|nr:MBL fold metallo-hydrolase [Pseudoclavibacter helvolus]MBB2957667.1 glyoxylase-like metal-dependent hydrolase (beta-lactamase superfamily II) [Pseudoclavibacter helvolus]
MKLDASLHRIGNNIVAAYLVVTPEGVTVIDAALSGHWRELLTELASIGLTVDDVKGVILTHGDSDHVGFAERLRRDHGVPVFIHAGDAERAKGGPKPATAKQSMKLGPLLGFAAYTLRKGGARTEWLTEVVEVQGGETLDLPGSPQIISMPGHSEGSIAVYVPAADAVFVGDGLTTRHVLTGQEGPQPAPFTDEPAQAIASLQAIVSTKAKWVLPGHGAPWSEGVDAAVAAVESVAAGRR